MVLEAGMSKVKELEFSKSLLASSSFQGRAKKGQEKASGGQTHPFIGKPLLK
jgi:hypothetical protein